MYLLLKMRKLYCAMFAHPTGTRDPQKYCIPNESCYLVVLVSIHLKSMLVKLDHFPKVRGEHKTYLKPPPSHGISQSPHLSAAAGRHFRGLWRCLRPADVPSAADTLRVFNEGRDTPLKTYIKAPKRKGLYSNYTHFFRGELLELVFQKVYHPLVTEVS